MPCTYCNTSFSIIKWKNRCQSCSSTFCTNCIIEKRCLACYNVLDSRLQYDGLMKVKVKDLKLYSTARGIPINTCREKNELVRLILQDSNKPITQQNGHPNSGPNYPRMPKNTRLENRSQPPYPQRGAGGMPQPGATPQTGTGGIPQPAPYQPPGMFHQPPGYNRTQEAFPTAHDFFTEFTDSSQIHVQATPQAPISNPVPDLNTSKPPDLETPKTNEKLPPKNELNEKQESPPKPVPTGLGNKLLITDLTSAEQIDNLSVREMKQILVDNFVDYKGCVERSELLSRVKNLYKDRAKNEEKQADEENGTTAAEVEDTTCRICWDKPIDCVLLECGHMVTCTSCGKKMNECPMCRQYVVRCVHVFRS